MKKVRVGWLQWHEYDHSPVDLQSAHVTQNGPVITYLGLLNFADNLHVNYYSIRKRM